eukprot:TRINITY_DN432_c0_g1_i7.p1 TRINITY_DN432_c0_g1~~TRINITY_DN432_c0_g1_i7.p1  ORF type:complete len:207 (-),score=60.51 TRINITY_DN432_c0_g1_i7:93-713(-)
MKAFLIITLLSATAFCGSDFVMLREKVKDPKCLKKNKVVGLMIRLLNKGIVDESGKESIEAAYDMFGYDIITFLEPNATKDPKEQVRAAKGAMGKYGLLGMLVMVGSNGTWKATPEENCSFLQTMLKEIETTSTAGVISDKEQWDKFVGEKCLAKGNGKMMIWYKIDGVRDVKEFKPFGGFGQTLFKAYKEDKLCDNVLDFGYRTF